MLAKRSTFTVAVLLTAAVLLGACGKKNPPPASIPPVVVTPTNNGGGFVGGSCGGVSGIPLTQNNQPYYANLTVQGAQAALTLNVAFAQQPNYTNSQQNIVGSGQLNLPMLAQILQTTAPIQNTTFCVSSAALQGGVTTPGVLLAGSNQLALTLRGLVQVPYYPPGYGSYSVQYYQEQVEVQIGQQCQAVLYQGMVYGCVSVKVGNRQPIMFQAN